MGVMASYCQFCGLPVQHDHYLENEDSSFLTIYRSSDPGERSALDFGPQHEWLTRGMALEIFQQGEPAFGIVEDGHLVKDNGESHFVGDGRDDRAVLHTACWEMAGRPGSLEPVACARHLHAWVMLDRYQGQLFEFEELVEDGRAEWLLDPNLSEGGASRERLQALLREVQRVQALPPPTSASRLALANCWSRENEPDSFWRYRDGFQRDLDLEGRAWKQMCVIHAFEGPADGPHSLELERFESKMLQGLEGLAVVLACRGESDQWSHLLYTDQASQCEAAIRSLGRDCQFDLRDEPQWETYFKRLHRFLAGRWERPQEY